jgi:hypothetical protein
MFVVGPYLFSGDELEGWLEARTAEAVAAITALTDEGIKGRDGSDLVREFHKAFEVPHTEMHPDGAHFTEERPLNAEERAAIGVKDEDAEKFKRITIAIPYSGDSHLLVCRPTIYSAHQPQAEVTDSELRLTWFLSEVEEFQLENNFKRQIALIDRTLEVTQWQAMAFNQELVTALSAALAARREAVGERS